MLMHRNGGTITALTHVAHGTYGGVASWFFIGNVEWQDGSKSENREIYPNHICGEPEEVNPLMAKLNQYLEDAGTWHDAKHKRDGRIYHWTPKAKQGRQAL